MAGHLPIVTVAVPLRDEAPRLPGLLAAVLDQTYPAVRLEVYLIDGGSTDATRQLAQDAAADHAHVHVLDSPGHIAAAALNLALAQAQGEVFVRLDARTRPAPDYIERCVARLQEGVWAGVAGPQVAIGASGAPRASGGAVAGASGGRTHALALNHWLGTGAPLYRRASGPAESETLYLGAFPTSWLRRAGGWDEAFAVNEDYELCERLRQAGGRLLVDPAIRSTYLVRDSLAGLARQYWRYGAWRTVTWRRHPRRTRQRRPRSLRLRHLAPAALTAALALGLVLLAWTPWPLVILLSIYAVVVLAASLQISVRHGLGCLPRLLLVFPTLHIAWGAGFWLAWVHPPSRRTRQRRPRR
jgi:cellulose synthase/poly-beta-1,6-N-acetylglucosamine synthase-like glycosyltransferase